MQNVTIDHVENIAISMFMPPLRNLHAFNYLSHGLLTLARSTRDEEIRVHREGGGKTALLGMGYENENIIACWFHWFSVSITNYTRLVALIQLMNKNHWTEEELSNPKNHKTISKHCREYVKKVIPEVSKYRNKISAHYAVTDPYKDDNIATLANTTMCLITYKQPYFTAGGIRMSIGDNHPEIPMWSLTEVYEKLSPRLWPDFKLPPIE